MDFRSVQPRGDDGAFELNLAPMLAMMVCLIPVLLLSVIFVKITIIDTPIPQVVAKALEKDRNKKDRKIDLALDISASKGFTLSISKKGRKAQKIKVPLNNGKLDLTKLHGEIVKMKLSHPAIFRLELNPDGDVSYEQLVQVMDEVRTAKKDDPEITLRDEETKKQVKTKILFPDVVFANVVGG